jgi:peptide/nickel transport system ATP-binding protein
MLLSAESLAKTYAPPGGLFAARRGAVRAVSGASFALEAGRSLGLVGESGSGKTTVARMVARFLVPDAGRLTWEGRPAESFSRREWAARVQMVFQDPSASLNPLLSVGAQLREALAPGVDLDGLLADVGLSREVLPHPPHVFSGGQRQRIAIARALARRPRLLIADEPVSSLDLSIQAQILNLLMDLRERFGLSLLVVSHDLAVVRRLTDQVIVMRRGDVVDAGDTAAVFAAPRSEYTRALLDGVPALLR